MDASSLAVIAEDLEHLRDDWSPEISEPDIRRGSAVLRRLLVEQELGRAWRALGFEREPRVVAVDLEAALGSASGSVGLAMAFGAEFRGVQFALAIVDRVPAGASPSPPPPPPTRNGGYPFERPFYLSEFLESLSGVAGKVKVKRRELIKYVANVRGGVHLGKRTKARERDLIAKCSRFEERMSVLDTDPILVETVAIAQAIGAAEDTDRLIRAITRRPDTR